MAQQIRVAEEAGELPRRTSAAEESNERLISRAASIALSAPSDQTSDVVSWHAHIPFAQALTALAAPRLFVELGVHKGDSYLSIVDAMHRYDVRGKAFGVDTWAGDEHAGEYDGNAVLADLQRRHERYTDFSTLLRKTFDDALSDVEDGSVDLLHIDGYHTYEAVRHDYETWRPKLSNRAIVLFHDIAVLKRNFGVHRFWEEIRHTGLHHSFMFGNGLGVLCHGSNVPEEARRLIESLNGGNEGAGVHPAQLFAAIGEAYAARCAEPIHQAQIDRLEAECNRLREVAAAEIGRLNREIDDNRVASRAQINKLEAECDSLREVAAAEIERLGRVASQAQLDKLKAQLEEAADDRNWANYLIAHLRIWPFRFIRISGDLPKTAREIFIRRIKDNAKGSLFWKLLRELDADAFRTWFSRSVRPRLGRAARVSGNAVLYRLPLRPERRQRIKLWLMRRFGGILGLRSAAKPARVTTEAGVSLSLIDDRYLSLTRQATGVPVNVPVRSVSIIVPVFNKIDYTLRCIEAVHRNSSDIDYELIVVDDCSTDGTRSILGSRNDIKYVRNEVNLGFIGSCNAGLNSATKTYVCYLNNDTEVGPFWLSALVNTFELHRGAGLVGSKLIYPDGRLQEAGGIIWNDFSGWNWGRLKDRDDPIYNYAREVDYCSGASLIIPRALALALGGFDTRFTPAYGEDSDLAFKIRSLGLSVVYQPLSQVIHFEGITSGTDVSKGVKSYQAINAEKLAKRWKHVLRHHFGNGEDPRLAADRGRVCKVLVLDQITPEPDRDAGSITALEIMRTLRDLGCRITFIPCSNFMHMPVYTDVLSALGIESVLYPWTKSVAEHMDEFGKQYDAIVIFRVGTALAYIEMLRRKAPQAKIIFHVSDLHFLREERAAAVLGADAPAHSNDADKSRDEELATIGSSDLTIVHSQYEQELLATLAPATPVVVFPWIYEPRGGGPAFAERRDLVFLGGYRHDPNVDAVRYFVDAILPRITTDLPDLLFHAVGSNPPPDFDALKGQNVAVPGFVEELSPVLWNARVMVVPLRYGAGLKGKIVSAMAHGLPVVTTTVGAEGMSLRDGEDVLIADTPEEFAKAVHRLYTDEQLWRTLSRAGLEYAQRHTSCAAGSSILEGVLKRLGLPFKPVSTRSSSSTGYHAPMGTPQALVSPEKLFEAATRMDPVAGGTLLVADGSLAKLTIPGWKVTQPADDVVRAIRVVAMVDGTDADHVALLAQSLPRLVAAQGSATIVFAPSRLVVADGEYKVLKPFCDDLADRIGEPIHERYAETLSSLGGTLSWTSDTSLTGFPSVTLAEWRP